MDSKLAKNNPGALSAVFQKTMCHLPKHYLLSFGPPRGHFKRDLKSHSELNTFFSDFRLRNLSKIDTETDPKSLSKIEPFLLMILGTKIDRKRHPKST